MFFYCIVAILSIIYSVISLSINIRRLKWKSIIKLLIKWVLGFRIITVLFICLIKGELRLTDKISNSVCIAFGSVFSGLMFVNTDDNQIAHYLSNGVFL